MKLTDITISPATNRPATALEWVLLRCTGSGHRLIRPHAQFDDDADYITIGDDGCWRWRGATNAQNGYGHLVVNTAGGRVDIVVHRLTYALCRNADLELKPGHGATDLVLDHNPECPKACVNPDHLDETTQRENVLRGRRSALKDFQASRYAGVSWSKQYLTWHARIRHNGGFSTHIGSFASEDTAAAAYDAALTVLGEEPVNVGRGLLVQPTAELIGRVADTLMRHVERAS